MFDLPSLRFEVTEPPVLAAQRACGKIGLGKFPPGMSAPVQYDSAAMAAAIHLTHYPMTRIANLRARYADLLAKGEALNPLGPKSGKRGRTRQRKAANLLLRLHHYADAVWRFATDHNVPFTHSRTSRSHGQGYSL